MIIMSSFQLWTMTSALKIMRKSHSLPKSITSLLHSFSLGKTQIGFACLRNRTDSFKVLEKFKMSSFRSKFYNPSHRYRLHPMNNSVSFSDLGSLEKDKKRSSQKFSVSKNNRCEFDFKNVT